MKRISFILVFVVLFMICAPFFSFAASAPFTFNANMIQPSQDSNKLYYILANSANEGICIQISSTFVPLMDSGSPGLFFDTNTLEFECMLSQSGTYFVDVTAFDLSSGNIVFNKSETKTNQYHITIRFNIAGFDDSSYAYSLYGAPISSYSFVHVDPFVSWFDPNNPPYVPPDEPVDTTSIVRSLLPRPLGTACTFYIADHLYLYSIFVGVPQQFEDNGYISSDDPNHFYGDNYNIFDLTFKSSGSSLQFTIKNRAEFSYNVIITKYDVVNGSFVSSQPHAVTAATNATTPGTSTFSIALSDPSAYGIYQSGFFARSHSVPYPELRISWSDTIDYTLDFFVIQQGLVTIVENQVSLISNFQTANSTLSTIASTSASILSQLQSFYTLCDSNFTWFKTTYFNSILNRWDINKTQLDTIISLLQGNGQTTYPENESVSGSVNSYVSQEDSYFQQFDEAGSAADGVFDEAISQFTANSNGFSFIRMILQTFVFNVPSSYIIVFVSLTFGLVILIIGRVIGGNKA